MRLLETAYHKLRPGSKIVLETINPACWFAFFSSYIRDITHVRPLHPDTLQYLSGASGFQNVERPLQRAVSGGRKTAAGSRHRRGPLGRDVIEVAFNENVEKLNSLLFTYLDYAAIGERL